MELCRDTQKSYLDDLAESARDSVLRGEDPNNPTVSYDFTMSIASVDVSLTLVFAARRSDTPLPISREARPPPTSMRSPAPSSAPVRTSSTGTVLPQ